ncbi:MAG: hypothetical protein XE06_0191, partial [Anaerolineaceae bacterium 46_22]
MSHQLNNWLTEIGITHQSKIYHNPSRSELVTQALLNNEGILSN